MAERIASRKDNSLLITVVNQNQSEDAELRIGLRDMRPAEVSALSLTGPGTRAQNTVDQPALVAPQPCRVEIQGSALLAHVPAHSVQSIRVKIS